jgi:hypothetical protein
MGSRRSCVSARGTRHPAFPSSKRSPGASRWPERDGKRQVGTRVVCRVFRRAGQVSRVLQTVAQVVADLNTFRLDSRFPGLGSLSLNGELRSLLSGGAKRLVVVKPDATLVRDLTGHLEQQQTDQLSIVDAKSCRSQVVVRIVDGEHWNQ